MALLEKAAKQGHAYAMLTLGSIHRERKDYEQAVKWVSKGADARLPTAMFSLGNLLDQGQGVAAPDFQAAAGWYRRAADAGVTGAAHNLSIMYALGNGGTSILCLPRRPSHCRLSFFLSTSHDVTSNIGQALGRGVTRSKRRAMQWMRKAAENGHAQACLQLAGRMYGDEPYAREVGHVGEADVVATSAGSTEGHDVPSDVMTGVSHWLRKGGHDTVVNDFVAWRWMGVIFAAMRVARLWAF